MYIAKTGLRSDKKDKDWLPGDIVKEKDFPKKVIKNWLQRGILELENPEEPEEEEEIDLDELFDLPDDELHIEDGE